VASLAAVNPGSGPHVDRAARPEDLRNNRFSETPRCSGFVRFPGLLGSSDGSSRTERFAWCGTPSVKSHEVLHASNDTGMRASRVRRSAGRAVGIHGLR